jgi:predicted lactoylglutathione lyase
LIFDHVGVSVSNIEKSKEFYIKCLKPLNIQLIATEGENIGFGKTYKAIFWIGPNISKTSKVHFAFSAETRSQVKEFYKAAFAAGGTDNGSRSIRKIYHSNYFAAFIFDPDGNNIEAVWHNPELINKMAKRKI